LVADWSGSYCDVQVNTVDPRKLTDELGEIFVASVLAVNVSATFIVHRGLYDNHLYTSIVAVAFS